MTAPAAPLDVTTDDDDDQPTSALIVACPAADDPVVQGITEPHITTIWFGEADGLPDDLVMEIRAAMDATVEMFPPFDAQISGVAMLGPDKARVYLVESQDLADLRMELLSSAAVRQAYSLAERQFPCWVPHLTMNYDGELPQDWPESFRVDSLGLWVAGVQTAFPLLGADQDPVDDAIEAAGCIVPQISTLADVDLALQVANQYPGARWYVTKRVTALGAAGRIPERWAKELAPR